MKTTDTIHLCIRRCARHRDGRGPWQAERVCAAALVRDGGDPKIAADVAAAARRIGKWLNGLAVAE
jgi:hypothetical protein